MRFVCFLDRSNFADCRNILCFYQPLVEAMIVDLYLIRIALAKNDSALAVVGCYYQNLPYLFLTADHCVSRSPVKLQKDLIIHYSRTNAGHFD